MLLKGLFDTTEMAWKILGKEIKICELGNQYMKWHPYRVAKKFFLNNGAKEHISIDVNGKDGALVLDLSKPLKWHNYFDLVTNYGTAEHVKKGIYECYKNIHDICKVNGLMINVGPIAGSCPWHSPYHYEGFFFGSLGDLCGYEILMNEIRVVKGKRGQDPKHSTMVISVFKKVKDSKFITKDEFLGIKGIEGL